LCRGRFRRWSCKPGGRGVEQVFDAFGEQDKQVFVGIGGRGEGAAAGADAFEEQIEEDIKKGTCSDVEAGCLQHVEGTVADDGRQACQDEEGQEGVEGDVDRGIGLIPAQEGPAGDGEGEEGCQRKVEHIAVAAVEVGPEAGDDEQEEGQGEQLVYYVLVLLCQGPAQLDHSPEKAEEADG